MPSSSGYVAFCGFALHDLHDHHLLTWTGFHCLCPLLQALHALVCLPESESKQSLKMMISYVLERLY